MKSQARIIESPPPSEPTGPNYLIESRVERNRGELLLLLWERRRFLGRLTAWGLLACTVIAVLIPNQYDSTARLMPPDSQTSSGIAMMAALTGKTNSSLGSLAGDLLGMKTSGALWIDILHSRTVEDRIIDRFDLRKVYWDYYWQDARRDLAKRTDVWEDRKSGVITITVTDRDPRRAYQIAQAYVDELNRLVAEVSTSSARRERIFIEQRLSTVKQNLDNASRQFSEYASKNTTIDIATQGKAMVEAAARLQGELIAAQSELESVEQIYTANNVRVRSLHARVEELKRQLDKLSGTNASSDDPDSQKQFPSIRQLPLLGVRWADLYRETKIQETVYELLTQQYELAKIQEAKEIPTVKVLDDPNLPEKKARPPRLVIILGGGLLVFLAGASWVIGATLLNQANPAKAEALKHTANQVLSELRSIHKRWSVRKFKLTNRGTE